jgi:hypothetical protein
MATLAANIKAEAEKRSSVQWENIQESKDKTRSAKSSLISIIDELRVGQGSCKASRMCLGRLTTACQYQYRGTTSMTVGAGSSLDKGQRNHYSTNLRNIQSPP